MSFAEKEVQVCIIDMEQADPKQGVFRRATKIYAYLVIQTAMAAATSARPYPEPSE